MEKLDLIIAALQKVELLFESHGQYPHTLREVNEALAAARELQALPPVGFFKQKGAVWHQVDDENHPAYTALYRLD
jgi:hypothetical protein